MRGKFLHAGPLTALILLLTMAASLLGQSIPAAALKNPGQDNIVISEFRSRGTAAGFEALDDFVEIFNPTSSAIDISGWLIKSVTSGGTRTNQYIFPDGTILAPGQHYLVTGPNFSGAATPDAQLTSGLIADNGGVALTLANGTVIDMAGMSAASAEGTPLPQMSETQDQSYERLPGDLLGSCYDSNDNFTDFAWRNPSLPQNSAVITPLTVCAAPTGSASPTSTFTSGMDATSTPFAPTHLVISEFRSRGPNGEGDEFVELYNPTGAGTTIDGWKIQYSSGCGEVVATLATIPAGTSLLAGQHYLLAANVSTVSGADQTFTAALTDQGGLALVTSADQVVDRAGMCITTSFHEGMNLIPFTQDLNQSYERLPGGATACYDTDNNEGDFALISPANPQGLADGVTLCGGVRTSTPTRTATLTRTASRTRGPTGIPDLVIINEFLPHPLDDWNGDGVVNEDDEFIEIINRGTVSVSLNHWQLDVGSNSISYTLPAVILVPGQIMVFFRSETRIPLNDGGGTVRLVKANGQTGDIYRYPPANVPQKSWCRLTDRNRGSLDLACQPTPGLPNKPYDPAQVTPGPANEPDGSDFCILPDTVPAAVTKAECGGFGTGISSPMPGNPLWLPGRSKWRVFVE
jgi:hypothetical protein